MRSSFSRLVVCALCLAVGLAATAALAEVDPAAIRGTVILDEEPAGAVSIADAKAKLTATPQPVVVAGRIGGRGTSPFGKNEATFSMLDIPTDDHAAKPGHKPDDCPFCKKRAANSPIAAVSFAGSDGKVIPLDAQKLFGLAEGQDVVVRGSGFFDPKLGIPVIQINADGLYLRKAK
ncbi:MAG: hypothetical protein KGR24_04095 [Planctomycetes bacterium]|nr:hypothetical protein [Planctomycetota bacterium]